MSSRERWIVYPLIFFALGTVLKDKITSVLDVRSLDCQELTVATHDGEPRIRMQCLNNRAAQIEMLGQNGNPQMIIQSAGRTAIVKFIDSQTRQVLYEGALANPLLQFTPRLHWSAPSSPPGPREKSIEKAQDPTPSETPTAKPGSSRPSQGDSEEPEAR
jgi:hypothetical protein